MPEVAIIINVRKQAHVYRRGPLGTYIVPPMEDGKFGYLVVRAEAELQDIGSSGQSRRRDIIPAKKICSDIVATNGKQLGLLICDAELDTPKSLERAEAAERDYLAEHPGETKMRKDPVRKMNLSWTQRDSDENAELVKLSERVAKEKRKFEEECRDSVTAKEVATAKANLTAYYQRLCKEADRMYSIEKERKEINIHHQEAAEELGYEPVWASTPNAKEDCPACGAKIKAGVAICMHCKAIINDAKAREFKIGPYAVVPVAAQPSK